MEKRIKLNPSQSRFVESPKLVPIIIGPMGEGKSWAAIAAMFYHAAQHDKPIRGAIIRDSFTNIERNTIPSINRIMESAITWHKGGRQFKGPGITVDLFGIDDVSSISILQGSEYHVIWLEEPAPVYEVANAGLREEVFDLAIARGPREIGSKHKVLVSMNPASDEHWTYRRFIENPAVDFDVIRIPYGENTYLPTSERARTMETFRNRPELYERYVKGGFASTYIGEIVMPEYREEVHRASVNFNPMVGVKVIRFWDGGLNPTCVFGQIVPSGHFRVLDTVRGENIGMKQLIETRIKPLISERYTMVKEWRDTGDPALNEREQSDSTARAADVIEKSLKTSFEPGESAWGARRESFKELLNRMIDGTAQFQLSKHEGILHRALKGGWHYRKDPTGKVLKDKPVKDLHSHPCDAVSHGIDLIFNAGKLRKNPTQAITDFNVFDNTPVGIPRYGVHQAETDFNVFGV